MKKIILLSAIGVISLGLSACTYFGGVEEPYYWGGPGYDYGYYGYGHHHHGGGHHEGHHGGGHHGGGHH